MGKKELATLVDAYADAKASGNKYLVQSMIVQLEKVLSDIFGEDGDSDSDSNSDSGSSEEIKSDDNY